MKMRSEQSWSLLDPKPVLLYVSNVDDYVAYWNGVAMPHSMALCMTMEFIGIYATPEMKTAMEANYRTIYYSNGFDTRAWDSKVENSPLYPYLKRIMAEHLKKVMEDKTPQEVLGWFNYTRARTQENVQDSLHRS
jgi:cobalamin biosynthesis Co2+ chelatase CbiK